MGAPSTSRNRSVVIVESGPHTIRVGVLCVHCLSTQPSASLLCMLGPVILQTGAQGEHQAEGQIPYEPNLCGRIKPWPQVLTQSEDEQLGSREGEWPPFQKNCFASRSFYPLVSFSPDLCSRCRRTVKSQMCGSLQSLAREEKGPSLCREKELVFEGQGTHASGFSSIKWVFPGVVTVESEALPTVSWASTFGSC